VRWGLTTAAASAIEVTVVGETEMQEQALEIRASIGTEVASGTINVCFRSFEVVPNSSV
jgi:hypothetical protein